MIELQIFYRFLYGSRASNIEEVSCQTLLAEDIYNNTLFRSSAYVDDTQISNVEASRDFWQRSSYKRSEAHEARSHTADVAATSLTCPLSRDVWHKRMRPYDLSYSRKTLFVALKILS